MNVQYGTTGGGLPTLWARVPYALRDKTRDIPGRQWDESNKVWRWLIPRPADEYRLLCLLMKAFPDAVRSGIGLPPLGELPSTDHIPALERSLYSAVYDSRRTPYAHQREAVSASLCHNKYMLLFSMGTGKTQIAIESASLAMADGKVDRVLITCPLSVVSNWVKEIQACALIGADDISVVGANPSRRSGRRVPGLSDAAHRAARIAQKATWTIIHYDLVRLHTKELATLVEGEFLVCDESHKLKSPTSQVSKAVRSLQPAMCIAMTGTPVANTPEDLWAQGSLVAPDLFGSHKAFEATYIRKHTVPGKKGFSKIIGYQNLGDLSKRLALVSLRRTKEQCLDLPPKVYQSRQCVMSSQQAAAYQQAQDDMLLVLKDKDDKWVESHAIDINAMVIRLSQIADGYASVGAGKADWYNFTGKLAVYDELIEELTSDGRKVVIFSRYRPPVDELLRRYPGAVAIHGGVNTEDRAEAQERFTSDPDCRVFVGQVDAAGLGLNLQAGSAVIFYDLPWSPSAFAQATDRCHRIGQERTVDVIDLQSVFSDGEETIDASVARLLARKQQVADSIVDVPWGIGELRALAGAVGKGRW